jgi:hypothetical protein
MLQSLSSAECPPVPKSHAAAASPGLGIVFARYSHAQVDPGSAALGSQIELGRMPLVVVSNRVVVPSRDGGFRAANSC